MRRSTMKILLTTIIILSTVAVVYAKDVFPDKDLKNIQFVDTANSRALILSKDGTHAEVEVGDTLGNKGGKVVDVQKSYISVETNGTRTRIIKGMELER
jgi:hypothetical protein